jgi:hypothetical protein
MRIARLLIFSLMTFLVQQCHDSANLFTLDSEFEIREDQLITVQLEGEGDQYINVQVLDITESRCPSNASCVRFGEAIVKLAATGVEETVHNLELCIGDCPQLNEGFKEADTVSVQLDGSNYQVILLEVKPYPSTQNQDETRRALITIISN